MAHDYDWLVIGSGFGGSVSALRLREKGYSVGVLECGRRFADDDFPRSTWDLRRYFWAPRLGMRGIFRLSIFKDVAIVSGSGVGGGSLGYANTLYRARRALLRGPAVGRAQRLGDRARAALRRGRADARRRRLRRGRPRRRPAARVRARDRRRGHVRQDARRRASCGEPGETVPDPFFGGAGPDRTGCLRCGRCMVGCPHGAKNTLVKNYLWLAERAGADVHPERTVVDVRPLGAADGSEGYEVTTEHPGAWLRRRPPDVHRARRGRRGRRARHQQAARRLQAARLAAARLRPRSATSCARTRRRSSPSRCRPARPDIQKRVAITGSIYPDPDTHIETVVYGDAADSMSALYTLLVGDGTRVTRPLKLAAAAAARHPLTLREDCSTRAAGRAARSSCSSCRRSTTRSRCGRKRDPPRRAAADRAGPRAADPDLHPGRQRVRRVARASARAGSRRAALMEAVANIPTTAHMLGGAVIGADPSTGVVDARQRVFGYENLLVCDGVGGPGQRRREPEPHHHGAGRARDEPRAAGLRGAGDVAREGLEDLDVALRGRRRCAAPTASTPRPGPGS